MVTRVLLLPSRNTSFSSFFLFPLAGKMGTNARICQPGAWDSAAAPCRRHQHKKNWYQGTLLCQGFWQVLFIPVLNFPADEEHIILGDTTQSCACKLKSWALHACWEAAHRWRVLAARCASWGHICGGFAACKGLLLHSEGKCDFPVVFIFFFFFPLWKVLQAGIWKLSQFLQIKL